MGEPRHGVGLMIRDEALFAVTVPGHIEGVRRGTLLFERRIGLGNGRVEAQIVAEGQVPKRFLVAHGVGV